MHDAHVHEMQCKCGGQTPGVLHSGRLENALHRLPPPRRTTSRQDGSSTARTSRQVLRSCRGRTLQTKPHRDHVALYPWRTGKTSAKRHPRWGLRSPCHAEDLGWKCIPTGLLLAHCSSRRRANRTHLRRVPVLRSANSPPGLGTPDDPHHMALRGLGSRPGLPTYLSP